MNNIYLTLANTKTKLDPRWQKRLLATGDLNLLLRLCERQDLTDESIDTLCENPTAKVRIALINGQTARPELATRLVASERRQTVLAAMVDSAELTDELFAQVAAKAKSPTVIAKVIAAGRLDPASAKALLTKYRKDFVEAHINREPLGSAVRQMLEAAPWAVSVIVRAADTCDGAWRYVGVTTGTVELDAQAAVHIMEMALRVLTKTGHPFEFLHYSEFDTALHLAHRATRSSELPAALRQQCFTALTRLRDIAQGSPNVSGYREQRTLESLVDLVNNCDPVIGDQLAKASSAHADDIEEAFKALEETAAGPIKELLANALIGNPHTSDEVVTAAIKAIDWLSWNTFEALRVHQPYSLNLAATLLDIRNPSIASGMAIEFILNCVDPSELIRQHPECVRSPHVIACLEQVECPPEVWATVLEVINDTTLALTWLYPEGVEFADELGDRLLDILGDEDEAWCTFEALIAESTQVSTSLVGMASVAAKMATEAIHSAVIA